MASLTWRFSSMVLVTLVSFQFIELVPQLTIVYSSCLCFITSLYVWLKVLPQNENSSFHLSALIFSLFPSIFCHWAVTIFISCYFVSLCSMLPDTLLTCHMYAQFISLYRQLLTEVIMDEGRDSQVAGNYWLYGACGIPLARVSAAFFRVLTMTETSVLISNCDIVEVFKRNITKTSLKKALL